MYDLAITQHQQRVSDLAMAKADLIAAKDKSE